MNGRNIIAGFALLICATAVCAILVQRQKLTVLRAEQQQGAAEPKPALEPASAEARNTGDAPATSQGDSTAELLQLRSQVTRLQARQRELAGVPAESERLRAQLAGATSNAAAGYVLPPGYIRKSQAQLVGYSTPENTIQSFLWALQNHDFTNLLQALTPGAAEALQAQLERSGKTPEEFFKGSEIIPGMAIQKPQTAPDGSVQVEVQVAPAAGANRGSDSHIENFRFRQINGEWKLDLPF